MRGTLTGLDILAEDPQEVRRLRRLGLNERGSRQQETRRKNADSCVFHLLYPLNWFGIRDGLDRPVWAKYTPGPAVSCGSGELFGELLCSGELFFPLLRGRARLGSGGRICQTLTNLLVSQRFQDRKSVV